MIFLDRIRRSASRKPDASDALSFEQRSSLARSQQRFLETLSLLFRSFQQPKLVNYDKGSRGYLIHAIPLFTVAAATQLEKQGETQKIMAKQVRGNDYLIKRLENEHPVIFADWKAGRYRSPRQALIAAGLRQPPKPINTLKSAWKKASRSERASFIKWIGATIPPSPPSVSPKSSSASTTSTKARSTKATITGPLVGPDQKLLPSVKARIETILQKRNLKRGEAMKEMGYTDVHDASLGMILANKKPCEVNEDLQRNLAKWLKRNKAIK